MWLLINLGLFQVESREDPGVGGQGSPLKMYHRKDGTLKVTSFGVTFLYPSTPATLLDLLLPQLTKINWFYKCEIFCSNQLYTVTEYFQTNNWKFITTRVCG